MAFAVTSSPSPGTTCSAPTHAVLATYCPIVLSRLFVVASAVVLHPRRFSGSLTHAHRSSTCTSSDVSKQTQKVRKHKNLRQTILFSSFSRSIFQLTFHPTVPNPSFFFNYLYRLPWRVSSSTSLLRALLKLPYSPARKRHFRCISDILYTARRPDPVPTKRVVLDTSATGKPCRQLRFPFVPFSLSPSQHLPWHS